MVESFTAQQSDARQSTTEASAPIDVLQPPRRPMARRTIRHRSPPDVTSQRAAQDFVYAVTHALQSGLRRISGLADMTAQVERPAEAQDAAAALDQIVDQMSTTIDQLLLLSRVDRPVVPTTLDMVAVITAARARVEQPLDICLPAHWPVAVGVTPWVEEIWFNLLNNAARHAGPSAHVTVRATREGDRAVYWIDDRGPGIPAPYRERIFEPFVRLDSRSRGQGLGLAIVARIARRLNGDVKLEDAPGGGARFRVRLPCVAPEAGVSTSSSPSAGP